MIADSTSKSTVFRGMIVGSVSGLPADTSASPVRVEMTAQPTNPTITRVAAHLSRRAAKPYRVRSPFRRMLLQKLHPKTRRVSITEYYDYHTRLEVL